MKFAPSVTESTIRENEPYRRGYRNQPHLREFIASAHRTNVIVSSATAFFDQIVIIGLAIATSALVAQAGTNPAGIAAAILACSVAIAVIVRQLRGLENLVHDGSHYNWSRRRRRLNDILCYALAAIPVGARLSEYRESHLRHHGRFGTTVDPDLSRYLELGIEKMDRYTWRRFTTSILVRFHAYQRGWLRSVGASPATGIAPAVWFTLTVSMPSWWWFGPVAGAVATVEWLVALLIGLPLLRFVAESSEHVYTGTDTVFDATISNLGLLQRLVVHPHNDGYHTVHHLWPGIPHHRLHRVHRHLLRHDPETYAKRLRYRTRVTQDPRIGIQVTEEDNQ